MSAQPEVSHRQAKIRRMTKAAFDAAVGSATSGGTSADGAVWEELQTAGLADGGRLTPAWARALAAAPDAPVQVRVVAREGLVSFESEISLLPGLGLCRTQRTELHATPDGFEPGGREDAVELVAFSPEELWLAVRRVLPPHDVLRAPQHTTPPSRERELTVPEEVVRELTERIERDTLGRTPAEILETAHTLDPELRAVLTGGDAEVALVVGTVVDHEGLSITGASRWAVVGERLYSLRSTSTSAAVVEVEAGDVAADLVWHVTGAYEAAAAIARGGAR